MNWLGHNNETQRTDEEEILEETRARFMSLSGGRSLTARNKDMDHARGLNVSFLFLFHAIGIRNNRHGKEKGKETYGLTFLFVGANFFVFLYFLNVGSSKRKVRLGHHVFFVFLWRGS